MSEGKKGKVRMRAGRKDKMALTITRFIVFDLRVAALHFGCDEVAE